MTAINQGLMINRRRLLTLTAAGVSVAAIGGLRGVDRAFAADPVRWVSPRGTLEVLDDYAYWVAKKFGYFGDVETVMEPGPSDATATVKLVDQGQADVGYPSPGVFSLGLEQGIPLVSVFHMVAVDTFGFAFRKGEAPASIKDIEGKTIVLGSAGWQSICDPMLKAAGVDISKVKYVDAGWPTWGTAVMAGQGDAALMWEGLRAQWGGQGLDFDYLLGKNFSELPANSFVMRKADFDDEAKRKVYARYLQGWAAGLEFGRINPRAATQIVMEQFPGLSSQMTPEIAVESQMQQDALAHGKWEERGGKWGFHILSSWQKFFDVGREIGQITADFKTEDVCRNELIDEVNAFDAAKVKADSDAFELAPEYAAVDVEAVRARV
jgi:NitT/TauT family transport system substrate-binding protein